MEKKNQHIVPACYLKPWCDPNVPEHYEPYVWRISKDGAQKKNKPPRKILKEPDFYTIVRPDGSRDLTVEDTNARLEDRYCTLVRQKIALNTPIDNEDKALMCLFAALSLARSKKQKVRLQDSLGMLDDMVRSMEAQFNLRPKKSLEIEEAARHAPAISISTLVEFMCERMCDMTTTVFVAKSGRFITSDAPCVMFNPEMYSWPPFYRHAGLGQEAVEVTLPLTPRHLLALSWRGKEGYVELDEHLVDEANRRTRLACHEYFISQTCPTKPIWFEEGKLSRLIEPRLAWNGLAQPLLYFVCLFRKMLRI